MTRQRNQSDWPSIYNFCGNWLLSLRSSSVCYVILLRLCCGQCQVFRLYMTKCLRSDRKHKGLKSRGLFQYNSPHHLHAIRATVKRAVVFLEIEYFGNTVPGFWGLVGFSNPYRRNLYEMGTSKSATLRSLTSHAHTSSWLANLEGTG